MDTILFYGDSDEATRRQVRSVAAQYSHRIGPRKRKPSKVSKQTGILDSKRSQYKKVATSVYLNNPGSSTSSHHHHSKTVKPDLQSTQKQCANGNLLIRREVSDSETYAFSSPVGSGPAHSPHTPQSGFMRSASASHSPGSSSPAYTRLPAYTWTEYPRYAVGQNGSASPPKSSKGAAAANRPAFELPVPPAWQASLGDRQHGQREPPRSHPAKEQAPHEQPHAAGINSDAPLPQALLQTRLNGYEASKGLATPSQLSPQPPLQILRCATEEVEEHRNYASRWRNGNEYDSAGETSSTNSPG